MPELPEVETIKRQLSEIENLSIKEVSRSHNKMRFDADLSDLQLLVGQKIISLKRRNKYLAIETSHYHLVIHLGMSGQFFLSKQKEEKKHLHLSIKLSNEKWLNLVDPRRFGGYAVFEKKTISYANIPLFKSLGIEPFESSYTKSNFLELLKKTKNIKQFLLDSANVCGIGNIYASETLFFSKIKPTKKTTKLTKKQKEDLYNFIPIVLQKAIDLGGSSISDFVHINGQSGSMQNNYKVYSKAGLSCSDCQSKIKKINQFGRSTYYCPNCQK